MQLDNASVRVVIINSFLTLLMLAAPSGLLAASETSQPEDTAAAEAGFVRPSQSPFLRIPDATKPVVALDPYQRPPGPPPPDPAAAVVHTLGTNRTEVVPSYLQAPELLSDPSRSSQPFSGLAPPAATPGLGPAGLSGMWDESVIGSDGRVRITSTGSFPWRTVVRLRVDWGTKISACSGAMISHYHVLTAGHCVYSYSDSDWADSIQVFPGLDETYTPYNYAWATRLHTYSGWTNSGMGEHDWAVIALDRRIGSFTGWMGRKTDSSSASIYTATLNVAGYPGTPDGNATCPTWANCMYADSDSGHSADLYNHWYWMDTSGGMSGGPVWAYFSDTGDRFILTTHTCGTGVCGGVPSNGVNHGTRLNNDKFDRIPTWISGDADIAPVDRPDLLDDGEAFAGFTPTAVYGGQSFDAWSDVRNVGTASSGSFQVSYYASTNSFISTGDYLLGNSTVSAVSPFDWEDSSLSVAFPQGVPDGNYYVGWIIDSAETVTEFDESNNKAYKSGYTLSVCNKAEPPSLVSPGNGASTTDRTPTFDWFSSTGADSYRIQIDDDSNFSSPLINTTTGASSYTPASNLASGSYYWRVRADKSCGTHGDWSGSWALTISSTTTSSCETAQVSNTTINVQATHGACGELTGGPSLTVGSTGDVTLQAGARVILNNGFRVNSGGVLAIKVCGHSLCSSGSKLQAGCHSCVSAICQADSYCCSNSWDSQCVAQVGSICGLTCP